MVVDRRELTSTTFQLSCDYVTTSCFNSFYYMCYSMESCVWFYALAIIAIFFTIVLRFPAVNLRLLIYQCKFSKFVWVCSYYKKYRIPIWKYFGQSQQISQTLLITAIFPANEKESKSFFIIFCQIKNLNILFIVMCK